MRTQTTKFNRNESSRIYTNDASLKTEGNVRGQHSNTSRKYETQKTDAGIKTTGSGEIHNDTETELKMADQFNQTDESASNQKAILIDKSERSSACTERINKNLLSN